MSANSSLPLVQQYLTRYGMTTYLTLGSIGLLSNIAILTRPKHVRKPGSLYILTMSFCAFIGLYICVIPVIYSANHSNTPINSPLYCQVQFYFRHAFNQMMRTFFIVACADRYASSSSNHRIRSFNQIRVAFRVIPIVITIWLLIAIFPANMLHAMTPDGRCVTRSQITMAVYLLIVVGIIPLFSMITFSVLLFLNLKRIRRRIQPVINMNQLLRKRDRDMIRMLLVEVMCYIITTIPLTASFLYGSITLQWNKSQDRLNIESFISYFTNTFLLYINNGLSFWIYICTSRSFRFELRNLIIKLYGFIRKQ